MHAGSEGAAAGRLWAARRLGVPWSSIAAGCVCQPGPRLAAGRCACGILNLANPSERRSCRPFGPPDHRSRSIHTKYRAGGGPWLFWWGPPPPQSVTARARARAPRRAGAAKAAIGVIRGRCALSCCSRPARRCGRYLCCAVRPTSARATTLAAGSQPAEICAHRSTLSAPAPHAPALSALASHGQNRRQGAGRLRHSI